MISIHATFDGGNIEVLDNRSPDNIRLAIRRDAESDFYQWFYFRLSGAAGVPCRLVLTNAAGAAYPEGWVNYRACLSEDRRQWHRIETAYEQGELILTCTPRSNSVWIAYFAPYPYERHQDMIAHMALQPGVDVSSVATTLDGRPVDLLTFGTPDPTKPAVWLIARQHPGETMAQWWMEGALDRLIDLSDPVTRRLRETCTFYIVPNMNPDGSVRGHLRTNAAGVNLNREWQSPSLDRSPEVYGVLNRMVGTGVDFCLDVHGDEALPHAFIAGFDGIPSLTPRMERLLAQYQARLEALSPDFQTRIGYPKAPPGEANMTMSTNALAERFGCLAMTLEMPFKDALDCPEPTFGWSPERAMALGRACLDALLTVVPDLKIR